MCLLSRHNIDFPGFFSTVSSLEESTHETHLGMTVFCSNRPFSTDSKKEEGREDPAFLSFPAASSLSRHSVDLRCRTRERVELRLEL